MPERVDFSILQGETLVRVDMEEADEIYFECASGNAFRAFHDQDCCEGVMVEDVIGDWSDIIGYPIVSAEEATNSTDNPPDITKGYQDSFTWTFYKLATSRGRVTIRWYGESNGYYSESVELERAKKRE